MLRPQNKRRWISISSDAVLMGLMAILSVAFRSLITMFAVNWLLAPWTDTRIDSWAALGFVLLLNQIEISFINREQRK